jgi:ABC-type glycerol-3-phosphate transport system permease component
MAHHVIRAAASRGSRPFRRRRTADVGAQYGVVAAYGSLIILPIIVFALVVNRYIVSGLTQGAVKG